MKRFLVFAYPSYYPGGGWCDFKKSFEFSQQAFDFADNLLKEDRECSGGIDVIDLETEKDIYVYPQHREGYLA